jgi:hypothetical protein
MARRNGIAYARQHICNRICHISVSSFQFPVSSFQ